MIIQFKYGFEYKGFNYGWYNKKLYRLPSTSGNNTYGLRELPLIDVGNLKGYRVKKDKLSIPQLKNMTKRIKVEVEIIQDNKHIPA